MTIAVAWTRTVSAGQELIFATDSRLTGGGNIDYCQKIFSLSREDCGIAFCGHTFIAYPYIQQVENFIRGHKKILDRATDVVDLKGKLLYLLNEFVRGHQNVDKDDFLNSLSQTKFIFGGWSWKRGEFVIWIFFYDAKNKMYSAKSIKNFRNLSTNDPMKDKIAMIGDYEDEFFAHMNDNYLSGLTLLDNIPIISITDMLMDERYTRRQAGGGGAIGGAPQFMKIYPFCRTQHFAVRFGMDSGKSIYLNGRKLLPFETSQLLIVDPTTGRVENHRIPRWRGP